MARQQSTVDERIRNRTITGGKKAQLGGGGWAQPGRHSDYTKREKRRTEGGRERAQRSVPPPFPPV